MGNETLPPVGHYRPPGLRLIGLMFVILGIFLTIAVGVGAGSSFGEFPLRTIIAVSVGPLMSVIGYFRCLVPQVRWDESGLTVRNPLHSYTIPWTNVTGVRMTEPSLILPGRLAISRPDASDVVSSLFHRTRRKNRMGRNSMADELADGLSRLAQIYGVSNPSSDTRR